jgi:hypothetical protein
MTSSDDVARLHGEGFSIRAIAERLGLSRMKVHRTLTDSRRADDWDDDDDETDEGLALFDGEPVPQATPPFTFVGINTEWVRLPGDDYATRQDTERYLDANGRSVSVLDIWRADFADGSEGHGYMADAQAQIEAAGYRKVSDPTMGRWHWAR